MHIISKRMLREFWQTHSESEIPLDNWYRLAVKAAWRNLVEVQSDFRSADLVGNVVIFNIGGNKYRLAVKIEFDKQLIFIKDVLTHSEYSNKYK